MIKRYAMYNPNGMSMSDEIIRSQLPESYIDELIKDPRLLNYVWIDLNKKKIVADIDDLLKIKTKDNVIKYVKAEVTKDDINQFSHFFVSSANIKYGLDVEGIPVLPSCKTPQCPIGGDINPPYVIKNEKIFRYDFGGMQIPGVRHPILLISGELRRLFDENNITGLTYHTCETSRSITELRKMYVAKIDSEGTEIFDEVKVKEWFCSLHRIPRMFYIKDFTLAEPDLAPLDFQLVSSFKIGNERYNYHLPALTVTSQALKVILSCKPRGLIKYGFFLGEAFEPRAPKSKVYGID